VRKKWLFSSLMNQSVHYIKKHVVWKRGKEKKGWRRLGKSAEGGKGAQKEIAPSLRKKQRALRCLGGKKNGGRGGGS